MHFTCYYYLEDQNDEFIDFLLFCTYQRVYAFYFSRVDEMWAGGPLLFHRISYCQGFYQADLQNEFISFYCVRICFLKLVTDSSIGAFIYVPCIKPSIKYGNFQIRLYCFQSTIGAFYHLCKWTDLILYLLRSNQGFSSLKKCRIIQRFDNQIAW